MLWTFSPLAIWGSLSILTLTNLNLLSLLIVICSRAGVSFLHGPHQLYSIHYGIINLLCIAIEDDRNFCLHDNRYPLLYACQFNNIWMLWTLRKLLFLLLLSWTSNRVAISISKYLLLLDDLWLRLVRLWSLGLLIRRSRSSENGSTCSSLVILSELSVLSHVGTLSRDLDNSLMGGFRDSESLDQEILHHHLIKVTVIYL